jgi:hypothetical protein
MEIAVRPFRLILVLTPFAALAACGSGDYERVQMTEDNRPTVTYSYSEPSQYDSVAERADAHCGERYGKDAHMLNSGEAASGTGYEATFRCE